MGTYFTRESVRASVSGVLTRESVRASVSGILEKRERERGDSSTQRVHCIAIWRQKVRKTQWTHGSLQLVRRKLGHWTSDNSPAEVD